MNIGVIFIISGFIVIILAFIISLIAYKKLKLKYIEIEESIKNEYQTGETRQKSRV